MRFHLLLARTLGFPSRQAMYRAMTARQLREWEAEFCLSPWDERRRDLRAGVVASAVLAPHIKQDWLLPSPESFVMYGDGRGGGGGQSVQEMKAVVERVERRHREARKRKRKREGTQHVDGRR